MHKYENRINYVQNVAHSCSDDRLNLDLLADLACLSKYHFIKVFTEYTGETPINFLKRIRLERAAHLLSRHRNINITDIALSCGFSSSQVFSRAFSERFTISPRKFRSTHVYRLPYLNNDNMSVSDSPQSDSLNDVSQRLSLDSVQIEIIQQKAIKVAYVRSIGAYGESDGIYHAIESVKHWAKKQGLITQNTTLIGMSWDNDQLTPNTACRYDACITLPAGYSIKSDISVQIIPGGLYAVFRTSFYKISEIEHIWHYFSNRLSRELQNNAHSHFAGSIGYEVIREDVLNGKFLIDLYYPWRLDRHDYLSSQ